MTYHDTIIIGAGPAGLQMGYYLQKAQRDYLIVEANDHPGSFFSVHPRHRTLISLNKRFNWFPEAEFNMRHDWNSLLTDDYSLLFGDYSDELFPNADAIVRYMADYAEKFQLNISYNIRIEQIDRPEDEAGKFVLTDIAGNNYRCNQLLVATGPTGPLLPDDIEGVELCEGYEDHDLNPETYANKRVLIIGRGNSAFEVADHLAGHAAIIHLSIGKPIKHAWHTHYVGDLRAINNTIIDMYQLKSLHSTLGFWVKKVSKNADGTLSVETAQDVPHWKTPGTIYSKLTYDHVIRCTGWQYIDQTLFTDAARPATDEKGKYPILDTSWETTVPGLFFIGTSMAARDRRAASGFIHGFRYNVKALFHLLEERYNDSPLPTQRFALQNVDDLRALGDKLIERASMTSALYQQNALLCDVLVFKDGYVDVVRELPIDYVLEKPQFTDGQEIMIFTLEYGFHHYPDSANSLDFIHPADEATDTACAAFLHPIFRHYSNGELVNETHLSESLVVRYGNFRGEYAQEVNDMFTTNIVMNAINKIVDLTNEVFSETVLRGMDDDGFGFKPWSDDVDSIDSTFASCIVNHKSSVKTPH